MIPFLIWRLSEEADLGASTVTSVLSKRCRADYCICKYSVDVNAEEISKRQEIRISE